MKHTPGPWKVVNGSFFIIPESAEKDKSELGYQSGHYIAQCFDTIGKTQKANARLIAKAPEMFEMLKEAYIDFDKGNATDPETMWSIIEIIEEIEGERNREGIMELTIRHATTNEICRILKILESNGFTVTINGPYMTVKEG